MRILCILRIKQLYNLKYIINVNRIVIQPIFK